MASFLTALVVFTIFHRVHLDQSKPEEFHTPSSELLERVFLATEKLSAFFKSDYSQVNVDGLFGLRLGQGQLIAAVEELGNDLDFDILNRLELLTDEVDRTCEQVLPYVEARDEKYFEMFHLTIEEPYLLPYEPRLFSAPDNITRTEANIRDYDETAGDICLSKIMGTFIHDDMPVPVCTSDEGCYEMMTKQGTSGYTLTHQLLYFILGEKMECRKELREVSGQDIDITEIETRMCKEIYHDALRLIQDGDVPSQNQDLFMEQISLCGVLGFHNFVSADWIKMVLRWPNAEGCFTLELTEKQQKMARAMRSVMNQLSEKVDREREQRSCEEPSTKPGGRKLLREFPMRDGCMAHKSGLGFSTLATFLRHLLRLLAQGKLQ